MKIVIISTMKGFSWGGSEELWWHTALYAKEQGHTVKVVVFDNKPAHDKIIYLQQHGITVDFIGEQEMILPSLWQRGLNKLLRTKTQIQYRNRFDFLDTYNADLILLNQGGATDIVYYPDLKELFNKLSRPFVILNQHHVEFGSIQHEERAFLLELFKKSRKVFFVAQRNKEVMERQLAIYFTNGAIAKNPVNLLDQSIVEWPAADTPQFAVVARLDVNYKAQDILLQALSSVKWMQRDFTVNFFGDGPDKKFLLGLIQLYGLEKKVFLKGHTKNIRDVWSRHHILVLPSISEGLPLSEVEAMLCGRPCLVTDVGDAALLVQEDVNGWVADFATVRSIDRALEKAWSQQQQWKGMGIRANDSASRFVEKEPGKAFFEQLIHA